MTLRVFTPDEANRTLPLVRRIVRDILDRGAALRKIAAAHPDSRSIEVGDRIHELQHELGALLAEMQAIGCDYKDWGFDKGLVDFPGFIDSKPVLLCWRSDEPSVEWFHEPHAGYAGRQRIPSELLEATIGS